MNIRKPTSDSSIEIADWLETFSLLNKKKRLSKSSIRRKLHSILPLDRENMEVILEMTLMEISRRDRIVGSTYPFFIEGNYLQMKEGSNFLSYKFLLFLVSSESLRSESRHTDVELTMDMLVLDALSNYFAGNSTGVHFGWPTSGERPPGFPAAIKWLANKMGMKTGKGEKRSKRRDGGVDVVVWRPFNDNREGFVTLLAQCTIAFNWPPKAKDIVLDLWRGYIDFGKDPITCLAIPFVIPKPFEKWDELRRTVHFVLDRLRLCELLEDVDLSMTDQIKEWTDSEAQIMLNH